MIQRLLESIRGIVERIACCGKDQESPLLERRLPRSIAAIVVTLLLLSAQAQAQSIVGTWFFTDPTDGSSMTFQANGQWSLTDAEKDIAGCPGPFVLYGSYAASGGSISMTLTSGPEFSFTNGNCVNLGNVPLSPPINVGSGSYAVSGDTLAIHLQGDYGPADFALKRTPFVVATTTLITATSATISTAITFNETDLGKQGAVFVTSWAPVAGLGALGISATANSQLSVTGARNDPRLASRADHVQLSRGPLAELDASAFVLVQLTSSGWQLVVNGQLIPYATGVLGDQLAAQQILNNANPTNLKGAQFCLGYGTSAAEMVAADRMLPVASIPDPNAANTSSGTCLVVVPQAGVWWNPAEGGRGFVIEQQGNSLFFGAFLYDSSGRSTWYAAGGGMAGSTFSSTLTTYAAGQTLTGPYVAPVTTGSAGNISITFTDSSHGTLNWPGGTIPIQRFDVVTGGAAMTPPAGTPETGIWWNPSESGRGFALEIQGGTMFLGGYMFDANGNPIWYSSGPTPMTDAMTYVGTWDQYGNGQTMTGTYKPAVVVDSSVGAVRIQFSDTQNATLTLPNGTQIPITRFRF